MRRWLWLVCLAVTAVGCPRRKTPEHGIELVFRKKDDVRLVVERRLAQLGMRARLTEDEDRLSIRLPDRGSPVDVEAVKAVLSVPASLEFCAEAELPEGAFCQRSASGDGGTAESGGLSPEPDDFDPSTCTVVAAEAKTLRDLVDGGSQRVVIGPREGGGFRTWAVEPACVTPRLLEVESSVSAELPMPVLTVTFDAPSSEQVVALTGRLVNRRLIIVLDGEVTAAPLVRTALTGGRAIVPLRRGASLVEAKRLAAALVGGVIDGGLTFEREARYGPPTLAP